MLLLLGVDQELHCTVTGNHLPVTASTNLWSACACSYKIVILPKALPPWQTLDKSNPGSAQVLLSFVTQQDLPSSESKLLHLEFPLLKHP